MLLHVAKRVNRPTARVVLLDEDDRVLLVRVLDRVTGGPAVWLTPGGGVEEGEDLATAAMRELQEETGLTIGLADIGRPVAVSRGDWEFRGQPMYSEDWYFVHRTSAFKPDEAGWTELEKEIHAGWRWWTLDELDHAPETVIPAGLAGLVRGLGADPPPPGPIELEWTDA